MSTESTSNAVMEQKETSLQEADAAAGQQLPKFVAAGNAEVGRFAVFSELLDWSEALETPAYLDSEGANGIIAFDLSQGVKEAWKSGDAVNKHPSEAGIDLLIVTESRKGHTTYTKRHTKLNGYDVWFAEDVTGENEYSSCYSIWYIVTEEKFIYFTITGKTKEKYESLRDVFASTYKL